MGDTESNPAKDAIKPLKSGDLFQDGKFASNKYEIRQNKKTVYTTERTAKMFKPPRIDIRSNDKIIATVKLESSKKNMNLFLGGDVDSKSAKGDLLSETDPKASKYQFEYHGRKYFWTRTHRKGLGANLIGERDFKLVEESSDQVLMVYRNNQATFKKGIYAFMEWYAELEPELEALSLAAIQGIQERVTRAHHANTGNSMMAGDVGLGTP